MKSLIILLMFIAFTGACIGKIDKFIGFRLVVFVNEGNIELLASDKKISLKEIKELMPEREKSIRWIFLCNYEKNIDGALVRTDYQILPLNGEEFYRYT